MRILYFSRSLSVHDQRFLRALAESEHEIYFMRLERDGVQGQRQLPGSVNEVVGDFSEVMAEVKPDLVHAGPLHSAAWQAAQSGFHPLVAMSWGSDILYEAETVEVSHQKVVATLAAADVLIGDCQAVADKAAAHGFPPERIVTFPWGVDLGRFSPAAGDNDLRAELGWDDAFVLLHNRAWEDLYDPLTVARAFVKAAGQESRLRLLLPGACSLEVELKTILNQAGLADRVHMPGILSQTDLPHYYGASDLYVSASRSDGSSVSLMEALACGTPALVSDIPGNREWIQPNENGWLFAVGDADQLAGKIIAAASADLHSIGIEARKVAEERADWQQNKQGIFRAYDLALTGAGESA